MSLSLYIYVYMYIYTLSIKSPSLYKSIYLIKTKHYNICNICPDELHLHKENTDKHEASYLDLDIKI